MARTKSLDVSPQFKWNEPWRRARLVQRAGPHLGEGERLWQWGWGIALGGALAVSIVCLLLFV